MKTKEEKIDWEKATKEHVKQVMISFFYYDHGCCYELGNK